MHARSDRGKWLWSLTLIACLAAALRLHDLGGSSLWVDECHTLESAQAAQGASFGSLVSAVTRGFSTYFLLLAGWIRPETPEWEMRLPSALAGVALAIVLALVGRDVGGDAFGLRLGVATAFSPFLVWHSREARWYPLTWLLVGIGSLCFVRARRHGRWRWVAGCLVAGLAAASSYPPAVTLLLIQVAWLGSEPLSRASLWRGWLRGHRGRTIVLGASLAGACVAAGLWIWNALLAPALAQGGRGYEFHELGGPTIGSVGYTGIAYATGYTLGPGPSEWHVRPLRDLLGSGGPLLALGAGALCILMVLGLTSLSRKHGASFAAAILTLAVVPPALVLAASWWTDHAYAPRHVGMAYPFALLLAVAGLGSPTRRHLAWALAGVLLAMQGVSLWNLYENPRYSREDVRSAARYVAAHAGPGDLVLVFGGIELPWKHYYRGVGAWKEVKSERLETAAESGLQADLDGRNTVWTVRGRLWERPGSERFISIVETWAPAAERRGFAGPVLVTLHHHAGKGTN